MKLLALLAVLVSLFFASFMNGWALSALWGWFVVPALHVPAIGVWTAVGLAMLTRAVNAQWPKEASPSQAVPKDRREQALLVLRACGKGMGRAVGMALVYVSMGWLVKTLAGL